MNSPKGKLLKNKLKSLDTPEHVKLQRTNSSGFDTSPNVLSPCDPNKMSATPGPYNVDSRNALKMSRRKLTMVLSGKEDQEPARKVIQMVQPNKVIPIAPKIPEENSETWPTKERLKYARDKFKRTLELAVETSRLKSLVKEEPKVHHQSPRRKRKKNSQKAESYPELKQALNQRPQKSSSRNRMPSIKLRESKESEVEIKKELSAPASPFYPDYTEDIEYNDEDDDEDYDKFYKNYIPFTGLKQAKRRKKFKQSVY